MARKSRPLRCTTAVSRAAMQALCGTVALCSIAGLSVACSSGSVTNSTDETPESRDAAPGPSEPLESGGDAGETGNPGTGIGDADAGEGPAPELSAELMARLRTLRY